jgi:ZIP family zinc transporter
MTYEIIGQSIIAGLATVLGALIILVTGRPGEKLLSVLLGFAGGVMTAVVIFDLVPSALVYGNLLMATLGFLTGLCLMLILDVVISLFPTLQKHNSTKNNAAVRHTGQQKRLLKMGYLIAIGIALHDLPEGIAIAVGYAAKENLGLIIALAIGMHNVPEGMAIAAPLTMAGISRAKIVLICLLISLFTPLGAYLGILLVSISSHFISLLLALAGGAMVYIVKSELLPEARRHHPNYALCGFALGILLIISLSWIHG